MIDLCFKIILKKILYIRTDYIYDYWFMIAKFLIILNLVNVNAA